MVADEEVAAPEPEPEPEVAEPEPEPAAPVEESSDAVPEEVAVSTE